MSSPLERRDICSQQNRTRLEKKEQQQQKRGPGQYKKCLAPSECYPESGSAEFRRQQLRGAEPHKHPDSWHYNPGERGHFIRRDHGIRTGPGNPM